MRTHRLAAGLVAGLVGTALYASAPALGAATPAALDYTINVDANGAGPAIDPAMYGVFFEDINRAADGGLYAELVQNRSFEYLPVDNGSYTGLTSWSAVSSAGGSGTIATVNDEARLNERNRTYLKMTLSNAGAGTYGVMNSGYNTGIAVEAGKTYDFSVWARTDAADGTPLTVTLRNQAGIATYAAPVQLTVQGDTWRKYTGTFVATGTTDAARLAVEAGGTGTVRLDMVSLFPRDTFKGHPNGLRKDLAEKIAALKPGFVRFPGGCLVNTGSMYGYTAEDGYQRARSYQWKDTIGPVEERATNKNFWGYNQSYGLGYYEYFQFSEDLGAKPVPVVPALVTGCGQNRAVDDDALLQRHIQDTLDLIEFANGAATSTWGAKRAAMGHPEPFGLDRIEVGNEENLPDAFMTRFVKFRDAIKAKYPNITVISNSGPDDTGVTFDRAWDLNRANGVEMVDEHYYNSPEWFLQNNKRYDGYDRSGAKVWLGEYASQDNKLYNALTEGAYMTGLERNADVVKMASYAPLLANIDYVQWRPDMIWFDNDQSWGSANYEVQKLFMSNVGDQVVPSTSAGAVKTPSPVTGAIGLSTWRTAAKYDDVVVTGADGTPLFNDDFSNGAGQWTPLTGLGSWAVQDGAYVQSSTTAENTMVKAGDVNWHDYDLNVKATKISGAEGFLVGFGVKDTGNYYWWNLGGWNNTQGAVEKAVNGGKTTLIAKPNTIETGRTYDVKVQIRGTKVTLLLDGQVWGSFDDNAVTEPFAQVVTRDVAAKQLIIKVVNAQDAPARTTINLGAGARVVNKAEMTVISGDPQQLNTRTAQPIKPVTSTIKGVAPTFTRTFEPNSVTFIRVQTK
ncbi:MULTISPECIES: alpha-L-arabinofuranosidase C-terminal domain-containing protein [Micromonospora]|uniref:non-reducing end alpha-L-arabinofuranosidase n=1 Tax=Micromonospora sicca TaxID=2202420 RepID=A0A317DRC7_9ACTN|nr:MULTISPECIES: alpha-L-arabinofuranosidase C-terminal domain-containing protein [unclassified Micromonospora]MBM0226058.1 carbohydrate binding domain-containing protein [Micromonospora sp. ATA51]PWR15393.1 alpha-N-arabinofuranosidase [Micromonospora sp. 4G51]